PVFPSPNPTASCQPTRSDHRIHDHNTFIDDPLGLSGSLFGGGSTNIWASDPRSTSKIMSQDNRSEIDPNSVFWAKMFAADEEREKYS
ncbi:unnamed protein product, partial [Wuchereria bancrofti]